MRHGRASTSCTLLKTSGWIAAAAMFQPAASTHLAASGESSLRLLLRLASSASSGRSSYGLSLQYKHAFNEVIPLEKHTGYAWCLGSPGLGELICAVAACPGLLPAPGHAACQKRVTIWSFCSVMICHYGLDSATVQHKATCVSSAAAAYRFLLVKRMLRL